MEGVADPGPVDIELSLFVHCSRTLGVGEVFPCDVIENHGRAASAIGLVVL